MSWNQATSAISLAITMWNDAQSKGAIGGSLAAYIASTLEQQGMLTPIALKTARYKGQ